MFISGKKLCVILAAIGGVLADAKDECGFIRYLMERNESFNCCIALGTKVKCSKEHITYINLSNSGIDKPLPDSIDLPGLTVLNISGNKISGSLPDLSNLGSLTQLDISGNNIEGEIPDSVGSLVNLKILNAGGNSITGISEKVASLPLLTDLDLSDNEIEGPVPTFISKFKNLKNLNLSKNKLTGKIPDAVSRVSTLVSLNLSHNSLDDSIPSDLSNLRDLRFLDLSHNELSGDVPTSLEKLSNMASLKLDNNINLTGKAPNIEYDSADYVCTFKNTNMCYMEEEKLEGCEYTQYNCSNCKENAKKNKDGVCVCKEGYTGAGYNLCSNINDPNLNQGSDSGAFQVTYQTFTLTTIILLASYILYFM